MATATSMKCACPSCSCTVEQKDAIMVQDQPYCSDACAQGHPDGQGCGHSGCGCG